MSSSISIKGTRDGLTITLGSGELGKLMTSLAEHLKTQGRFFRGGRVALDLAGREASKEELAQIRDLLDGHGMMLRTVMTSDEHTEAAAKELGLHAVTESGVRVPEVQASPRPPSAPLAVADEERAILLRKQVRSGQVVRHSGHVVIIGDVNPGAEVWASGNVVVWGKLRGTVRAGATGDDGALVCALDLRPTQLRIGEYIARSDEDDRRARPYAEVAHVRDGVIIIEPWSTARQRA